LKYFLDRIEELQNREYRTIAVINGRLTPATDSSTIRSHQHDKNTATTRELCNQFVQKAQDNDSWARTTVFTYLNYLKDRIHKQEITAGTALNYAKPIRLLFDSNNISRPWWKYYIGGLPKAKSFGEDRAELPH
jgi:hypothetical protein